jgi:hypothetical protein
MLNAIDQAIGKATALRSQRSDAAVKSAKSIVQILVFWRNAPQRLASEAFPFFS